MIEIWFKIFEYSGYCTKFKIKLGGNDLDLCWCHGCMSMLIDDFDIFQCSPMYWMFIDVLVAHQCPRCMDVCQFSSMTWMYINAHQWPECSLMYWLLTNVLDICWCSPMSWMYADVLDVCWCSLMSWMFVNDHWCPGCMLVLTDVLDECRCSTMSWMYFDFHRMGFKPSIMFSHIWGGSFIGEGNVNTPFPN